MKEFWTKIVRFVKEIPRVEKAIILTLLTMFLFIFVLTLIQLRNNPNEIMMEMVTTREDFVDIEKLLEEEKLEDDPITTNTKLTTQEFNEANSELFHSNDVFKSLDEIMEERSMAQAGDNLMTSAIESNLVLPSQEKISDVKPNEKSNKNAVNKNSLVRYSLVGREPLGDLPNPIYTCEASGRVVINIKVNAAGQVVESSFNEASSSTKNGCLIDNALYYAQNARFTPKSSQKEQLGTITYLFQGR